MRVKKLTSLFYNLTKLDSVDRGVILVSGQNELMEKVDKLIDSIWMNLKNQKKLTFWMLVIPLSIYKLFRRVGLDFFQMGYIVFLLNCLIVVIINL